MQTGETRNGARQVIDVEVPSFCVRGPQIESHWYEHQGPFSLSASSLPLRTLPEDF